MLRSRDATRIALVVGCCTVVFVGLACSDDNKATEPAVEAGAPSATVAAPSRFVSGTPCATTAECAGSKNPCAVNSCVGGRCAEVPLPRGARPAAAQTVGDCKSWVCDGFGAKYAEFNPTNLPPDDGNECTEEVCEGLTARKNKPAGTPCGPPGAQLACTADASCRAAACSTQKCNGESCCATALVPGGPFNRLNSSSYPATVRDFRLDKYEVTVGRFRNFVTAGFGTQAKPPTPGSGAHPTAGGWSPTAHLPDLPANTTALGTALISCGAPVTWTASVVDPAKELLPITCVGWAEAYAFCIWDGGRLPSFAEHNYAAAGGTEQRSYPWGAAITSANANYGCSTEPDAGAPCLLLPPGSKSPAGDGRWGHADLAGNAAEWVLDRENSLSSGSCNDCVQVDSSNNYWNYRGGAFNNAAAQLAQTAGPGEVYRYSGPLRTASIGFRCVHEN